MGYGDNFEAIHGIHLAGGMRFERVRVLIIGNEERTQKKPREKRWGFWRRSGRCGLSGRS